jgi:hypothetical protein
MRDERPTDDAEFWQAVAILTGFVLLMGFVAAALIFATL